MSQHKEWVSCFFFYEDIHKTISLRKGRLAMDEIVWIGDEAWESPIREYKFPKDAFPVVTKSGMRFFVDRYGRDQVNEKLFKN